MKAEIIRDDIEVAPTFIHECGEDVSHDVTVYRNGSDVKARFFRKGAVLEHSHAFRMVQMGFAVAADAECENELKVRGWSDQRIRAAQYAYERQKRVPFTHNKLYDAGYISGVKYEGDKEVLIPGPKWDEYQEQLRQQEAEDEEGDE